MSKEIINHLNSVESATLSELYIVSKYNYYANWTKHFGQVMTRLVKGGLVERVKPGVFRIGTSGKKQVRNSEINSNQLGLFTMPPAGSRECNEGD
jgi:hypothetical protein